MKTQAIDQEAERRQKNNTLAQIDRDIAFLEQDIKQDGERLSAKAKQMNEKLLVKNRFVRHYSYLARSTGTDPSTCASS